MGKDFFLSRRTHLPLQGLMAFLIDAHHRTNTLPENETGWGGSLPDADNAFLFPATFQRPIGVTYYIMLL